MKERSFRIAGFLFIGIVFALMLTACTPLEGNIDTIKEKAGNGTDALMQFLVAGSGSGKVNAQEPFISDQPEGKGYNINASPTPDPISVTAWAPDGGDLSYQWYKNTVNSYEGADKLTGEILDEYTPDISEVGELFYFVEITNTNTSVNGKKTATIKSDIVRINVDTIPIIDAETPSISPHPVGHTYIRGDTAAAMTVNATASDEGASGGVLTYQWYKNGSDIPGETGKSYTPVISDIGSLDYYVVVTNTNNTVNGNTIAKATSSTATIKVDPAVPSISPQPQGKTYIRGDTAIAMTVNATANDEGIGGILSYQWYKNGSDIPGETGKSYTPVLPSSPSIDNYHVIVTNKLNGVTTATATSSTAVITLNWHKLDTWSGVNNNFSLGIAYSGSRFVAVGSIGYLAYSDSIPPTSWTTISTTPFTSYNINDIAFGGGRFVAVGDNGNIAYSTNGTIWDAGTCSIAAPLNSYIYGIAYGGGSNFVAVGNDTRSGGFGGGIIAYSIDGGETWTNIGTTVFGGSAIYGITYSNGIFIAVGGGGKMAYSSDGGATWTPVASTTFGSSNIRGIAYGDYSGGRFVAVGEGGKMAYSDDNGLSWTAIVPGSVDGTTTTFGVNDIYGITYGNGKFVAVGSGGLLVPGKMAYSSDGISWTAVPNIGGSTNYINKITYSNSGSGSIFVAVGPSRIVWAEWP